MHWDDLRYLEALTRHGSATAAAREIGVAVSTVYRRLGALEESLGGPVVVKGAEGVVLTDAGRVLVDAARRTAVEVGAARSRTRLPASHDHRMTIISRMPVALRAC